MHRLTISLLALLCPLCAAQERVFHLEIGDPARKGREVPLVLDAVTDSASGEHISPAELARRLGRAGIVVVGESHTSMEFHAVQLRILEELYRNGRKVLIGLEMYPYTEQQHLDNWSKGLLTEKGFVWLSRWYGNWGYNWNYYRDIFLFAKERNIPMFALNVPRETVSAVRKKGRQNLSPEEAAHMPPKVDTESEEHFALFRALLESGEGMHSSMDAAQWRAMFDAQCTWDAAMAHNAVRVLREHGGEGSVMVVLIGSGHAAYGLGIQRQARQWYQGTIASVIPIAVLDDRNRPVETVRASYADFVWGIFPEKNPRYPDLGIATAEAPGSKRRQVLSVEKDSVAKQAGFEVGDILISMDGIPIADRETLNRMVSEKRWGDEAQFVVERSGRQVALQASLRRRAP